MDNFKGQVTVAMTDLLEKHRIHSCLLPPNTTDRLQPMDIAVNKPVKAFVKEQFQKWSAQVTQQLDGKDFETVQLDPVELSMAIYVKEIRSKWLVDTADYIM